MPMDAGPKIDGPGRTGAPRSRDLRTAARDGHRARATSSRRGGTSSPRTSCISTICGAAPITELDAAKARLGASAARAYKESGGGRVNAALDAMREANDLLDMSRDLHLISTYGDYELDVVAGLERRKRRLDEQILDTSRERADVKQELDEATAQVATLAAQVDDANRRLLEAESEMARFKRLATTAGSPIMGPNRLTAKQLADFIRRNGYAPNLTVTIDELAQYYIEESEKLGIRGDVAFAQSILETGGFNFAGSMVEVPDNNYAGIGACDSCNRGFIFPDARTGVRAQMQLLRVYVDPTVTVDSLPGPVAAARHAAARLPRQGPVVVGPHGHVGDRDRLRHPRLRPLHAHRERVDCGRCRRGGCRRGRGSGPRLRRRHLRLSIAGCASPSSRSACPSGLPTKRSRTSPRSVTTASSGASPINLRTTVTPASGGATGAHGRSARSSTMRRECVR